MEVIYLVLTRMPGESYCRRFRSVLLSSCDVFRAQIASLSLLILHTNALDLGLLQINTCSTSVQFKMVSMRWEKSIKIMRSIPCLKSFPNVAFKAVPVFVLLDDGPLSSFEGRSSSASSPPGNRCCDVLGSVYACS